MLSFCHRRPVYCWGHAFLPKQVGVVTYQMSPNRINPLAHIFHSAIFNTFRRCRNQFLYVVPPFAAAYLIMSWAEERCVFLFPFPCAVSDFHGAPWRPLGVSLSWNGLCFALHTSRPEADHHHHFVMTGINFSIPKPGASKMILGPDERFTCEREQYITLTIKILKRIQKNHPFPTTRGDSHIHRKP